MHTNFSVEWSRGVLGHTQLEQVHSLPREQNLYTLIKDSKNMSPDAAISKSHNWEVRLRANWTGHMKLSPY